MSAEFEAQILADLRRTHAQLKANVGGSNGVPTNAVAAAWSMRLTVEEVDLLLRIVDERDDLKRRLLSDWEPDLPVGVSAGPQTTAPPAGCPFADTIHDCPLGGCPDASPREAQIPDLPKQGRAEKVTRELVESVGREARETPRRRPGDVPGCCEECRGSGMVAVGPWGSRPPKTTCAACGGSGWSTSA